MDVVSLNVAILFVICVMAFFRPVWGLVCLFLLTSSLFVLERFATVPLPLGYIAPTEAVLCVLFLRLFVLDTRMDRKRAQGPIGRRLTVPGKSFRHLLLVAIVPYALWQTGCILVKLPGWSGTVHFRLGIRYLLSAVLPWVTPFLLLKLGARSHKVFTGVFYITLVTALVHVVLQVTDYRPLMLAAYQTGTSDGEYAFVYTQHINDLAKADFYRGLPQGTILILFFAVLYLAIYCSMGTFSLQQLAVALLLVGALAITFTRSLVISLIAGMIFTLILCLWAGIFRLKMAARVVTVVALCFACGTAYEMVRPGFWDYWTERIDLLSGADSKIFSPENTYRGLDNIASWNAISDHPLLGLGSSRYPAEYSLRHVSSTDIHPMLQIGLVGGIPAMFLAVWLQVSIIWYFAKSIRRDRQTARGVSPFLAVLCTSAFVINTIGAGGTLYGTGILALGMFIAEMAQQEQLASAVPGILQRSMRIPERTQYLRTPYRVIQY